MTARARVSSLLAEISRAAGESLHVTDDPIGVPGALADGRPVAVLQPPSLTFPTWGDTEAEWELYVAAGPMQDTRAAWETLDTIIEQLREPLALDSARPAAFGVPTGTEYPAYILTFTESI